MATSADASALVAFLQVCQTLNAQKLKRYQGLEFCRGRGGRFMALARAQLKLLDFVGFRVEVQCLEIRPEDMGRGPIRKTQLALVI
ncbi:hypothetical protein CTR2_R23930 [Comamonas thiooxydans]|uniref:hypothetical protein n=1 Tax=Comamonas thiooxydans TaxID=363952 RepID=UPI00111D7DC4|nr:hypothetical protein [Comamonas thiooxydans]BDR09055.1 hypothetical protein CTR2_R23930 [Comamonas thiooxydans]